LGENRAYVSGALPLGGKRQMDSVPVHQPALWFATMLKEALKAEGIEIAGAARCRSWPEDEPLDISKFREVGSVESPPLAEIIHNMMKPSQNLYAQLLLLQAGARSRSTPDESRSSEDLGLRQLRLFLKRAGIDPGQVLLEDGAGLSRGGLVTPAATVQLLAWMSRQKDADLYRSFLPVAGTDGTLRRRLLPLKGNVHAKTGTLRFVNTLSGYMTNRAGENLAFSVMLNAYNNSSLVSAREELDALVLALARVSEKTPQ
jgi:D-alanyl-D-alanine carboxypeptidase/D-alanyl-D-alanine-endopeptidase (penicillin-binding protein 4)